MRIRVLPFTILFAAILAGGLGGQTSEARSNCDSKNANCPDPSDKAPYLWLTLTTGQRVVDQSGTVTVTLGIDAPNTTGPVTLRWSAPSGLSAAFPASIPAGERSTTVSVKVSNTMAPGVYKILAEGTVESSKGKQNHTALIQVRVGHAIQIAVGPGVAPAKDTTPVHLFPCSSIETTVYVDVKPGVAGVIRLAVADLPNGTTATFSPATMPAPAKGGRVSSKLVLHTGDVNDTTGDFSVLATAGAIVGKSIVTAKFEYAGWIQQISPGSARTPMMLQPGTTVTLSGEGFCADTHVEFGDQLAIAKTTFVDPKGTLARVEIPRLAIGTSDDTSADGRKIGRITVTTNHGQFSFDSIKVDSWRNTNGFSFGNTKAFQQAVGNYSVGDFAEVFGTGNVVIESLDPVFWAYFGIVKALLTDGQCFGFALAANHFAKTSPVRDTRTFATFPTWDGVERDVVVPGFLPAGDSWHLLAPVSTKCEGPASKFTAKCKDASPNLSHYIHMQHLKQVSTELGAYLLDWELKFAGELKNTAIDILNKRKGGLVLFLKESAGHVLSLLDVRDTGGGSFAFDTYDPNVPFDPSEDAGDGNAHQARLGLSTVTIDKDGNWKFNDENGNKLSGGLVSIVVAPTDLFDNVHMPTGIGPLETLFGAVEGGHVQQITDATGHTMLLPDGSLNTNPATRLPRSNIMPLGGGLGHSTEPIFVHDPKGTYTYHIDSTGPYTTRFAGGGLSIELAVAGAAANGEQVTVDPKGAFEFRTSLAQRDFEGKLAARAADKTVRLAHIHGTAFHEGPSRLEFSADREHIVYKHVGRASTVKLEVASTKSQAAHFVTVPVQVDAGDVVTFNPVWSTLERGTGVIHVRKATGTESTRPIR